MKRTDPHGVWLALALGLAAISATVMLGYPTVTDRTGPGWWKDPVVIVAGIVFVLSLAWLGLLAYRTRRGRPPRPFLTFLGIEQGEDVVPLPSLDALREGRAGPPRYFAPLRALYANNPPDDRPGRSVRVWAHVSFERGEGTELTVDGRWAGEPQGVERPSAVGIPITRTGAGYWHFAPDGRMAPLDIALVERGTGLMVARGADEMWRPLKSVDYRVRVMLHGQNMEDITTLLHLTLANGRPALYEIAE